MNLKEEARDVKEVLSRLKKKDFSGNTGQAVKNSSYQLLANTIAKFGSLVFTIILAKMILPENFGLYSLALGTITIFTAFTGMGIGETLVRFVSKKLKENKTKKAKAYFVFLNKFRIILVSSMSIILIISSYWIANIYYQKPIFLALLAGALYLPLMSLTAFFESLFMSVNDFKKVFLKEALFQTLRFIVVISLTLILLNASVSSGTLISVIILSISLCYLIALFYYSISAKKINFLKEKSEELSYEEIRNLKQFIAPLAAVALSGIFFGYVDIIMLGYFVNSESIGQYSAAFNLAASIGTILAFSAISLLPIFSRLKGKSLQTGLNKSRNLTLILSIMAAIVVFVLSKTIVELTYGVNYLDSIIPLKILSLAIILIPLTSLYASFFISQNKTKTLAFLLIATTILNVILNYFFIIRGLENGMLGAIIGVCYASIICKGIYLGSLMVSRKMLH